MEDEPLILSVTRDNSGHNQFTPTGIENTTRADRQALIAAFRDIAHLAFFGPKLDRKGPFSGDVLRECVEIAVQAFDGGTYEKDTIARIDLAVVVRAKRLSDPALPAALLALL